VANCGPLARRKVASGRGFSFPKSTDHSYLAASQSPSPSMSSSSLVLSASPSRHRAVPSLPASPLAPSSPPRRRQQCWLPPSPPSSPHQRLPLRLAAGDSAGCRCPSVVGQMAPAPFSLLTSHVPPSLGRRPQRQLPATFGGQSDGALPIRPARSLILLHASPLPCLGVIHRAERPRLPILSPSRVD
jgi:hypothetical protein